MEKKLGSAKRARQLARLFEAWRRACDRHDFDTMSAAMRVTDAIVEGLPPRPADIAAIKKYCR